LDSEDPTYSMLVLDKIILIKCKLKIIVDKDNTVSKERILIVQKDFIALII